MSIDSVRMGRGERFSCSLAGGRQLLMPFVFEYLRRYNEMKVEIVTEGG